MNTVCRIGLGTAKNVFQAHTLDASGRTVANRRLRRTQVLNWFPRLDRCEECLVGLEAIYGLHWRAIRACPACHLPLATACRPPHHASPTPLFTWRPLKNY